MEKNIGHVFFYKKINDNNNNIFLYIIIIFGEKLFYNALYI